MHCKYSVFICTPMYSNDTHGSCWPLIPTPFKIDVGYVHSEVLSTIQPPHLKNHCYENVFITSTAKHRTRLIHPFWKNGASTIGYYIIDLPRHVYTYSLIHLTNKTYSHQINVIKFIPHFSKTTAAMGKYR